MMNDVLKNAGIDAFLNRHPEVALIRQLNPGLSTVSDLPEIKYFSLKESIRQP
jgi:hypothetical protein